MFLRMPDIHQHSAGFLFPPCSGFIHFFPGLYDRFTPYLELVNIPKITACRDSQLSSLKSFLFWKLAPLVLIASAALYCFQAGDSGQEYEPHKPPVTGRHK